jgi:hypothetical protein
MGILPKQQAGTKHTGRAVTGLRQGDRLTYWQLQSAEAAPYVTRPR